MGVEMIKRLSWEIQRLMSDLSGASGAEYTVIATAVSIAGIAAFSFLGDQLGTTFGEVAEKIGGSNFGGESGGSSGSNGSDGSGSSAGIGTSGGSGGSGGC